MKKALVLLLFAALCNAVFSATGQNTVFSEGFEMENVADMEDAPVDSLALEPVEVQSLPRPHGKVAFAWGAEIGGAIDMSGNDMSSVDFNAVFGIKWEWIKFVGIGVQADVMVSNSCRSYPVFLGFRTNFRRDESLLFWDFKLGVSLNYLPDDFQQSGAYLATGLGINLARGEKFSSHMIIGYSYRQRKNITSGEELLRFPDLHAATVKIGLSF